jgi:adenylate cyclase
MAGLKSKAEAEPSPGRFRFPLAVKLSLVVSALLIFSLGVIIFSVRIFVRADVLATAAQDNDNINYRVAEAAETALLQMRANTSLLLGNTESGAYIQADEKLFTFFFTQNPEIAAVMSLGMDGASAQTWMNRAFALSNDIDSSMVSACVWLRGKELLRGIGESSFSSGENSAGEERSEFLLFNAAPDFAGLPILVFRFPYTDRNGVVSAAFVFFSSEELSDYFGSGASRSVMVNDRGDILIHPGESSLPGSAKPVPGIEAMPPGENYASFHVRGRGFVSMRRIASGGAVVLTEIEDSVILEGINATTIRNIYFAVSVWFLSLLLIRFFSSRLTRQINTLGRAAKEIEEGSYGSRPIEPVRTHDETGILTDTMISMSNALLSFERFTNREIARLANKKKLTPGGSFRKASFLFSDIRSFTALSENMKPGEVVEFLKEYMERMIDCVMASRGVIDKFIGDAVMAHWGAVSSGDETRDGPSENDAFAAVRSSLMMRVCLRCFNMEREREGKPAVRIGCGINSGRVVAGQIGTEERLEYTVIGDAVNLAERSESCNKKLHTDILITEHTWRLVNSRYITKEMPSFTEKGLKIRLFALINVRDPDEEKQLLEDLEKLDPKIDMGEAHRLIGPQGPQTLEELRSLGGLSTPDLSKVNLDEREQKFTVQNP